MNGLVSNAFYDSPKETSMINVSPLEQYKQRRKHLEESLQRLDEVIQALEKNPEVAKIIELMAKANY